MGGPHVIAVPHADCRSGYDERFGVLLDGLVGVSHHRVPVRCGQRCVGERLGEGGVRCQEDSSRSGGQCRCGEEFERFRSHVGLTVIFLAIHHPPDPELVGARSVVRSPEHVLERHVDASSLRQSGKQPVGFAAAIGMERDVEIVSGFYFEPHGFRRVGAHEFMSAENRQTDVHYEVLVPVRKRRHVRRRRNVAEPRDRSFEFASEYRTVKLEGGFGLILKIQVGRYVGHISPGLGFRKDVRVHVFRHLHQSFLIAFFKFRVLGLFHVRGFERRQVAVHFVRFSAVEKNSGTGRTLVDVDFRSRVFLFFHLRSAGRAAYRLAPVRSAVAVFHFGKDPVGRRGEHRAHFVVFEKHPFAFLTYFHGSPVDRNFHERDFAEGAEPFLAHRGGG